MILFYLEYTVLSSRGIQIMFRDIEERLYDHCLQAMINAIMTR